MNKFVKSNPREKFYSKKERTKKNLITSDCVIRAIVHATGKDYKEVWNELLELSKQTLFLPNDNQTYEVYLKSIGWVKKKPLRNLDNKTFEVRSFPANARKRYIIQTSGHLTAIVNGKHLDTWDCGYQRANSYFEKIK